MLTEPQLSDDPLARCWTPPGTFHHVGFVVASIERTIKGFADAIGGTWDGAIVHDPSQSVRVAFIRGKAPADPLIELVESDGDRSPVA